MSETRLYTADYVTVRHESMGSEYNLYYGSKGNDIEMPFIIMHNNFINTIYI